VSGEDWLRCLSGFKISSSFISVSIGIGLAVAIETGLGGDLSDLSIYLN
jgi:hypothetical protein